ncbi:MAG: murein biosynthesis integral membrane protein MurJ [Pseudomonadota bacterium]
MSLARNTLVQSSLTLVSRLMGLARDVLLTARVGAGPVGDAFYTALMFPNLFRRIFAEGAFAQAFVPVFARTLEADGEHEARTMAQHTLNTLFAATAALTIAAQFGMSWILLVIHGGYAGDQVHFPYAVTLTQITMPYLTFMAVAALLSGVLNTFSRFVLSAGAPTLLNACLIAAALLGENPMETARYAAVAVAIAGLLQTLVLFWGVRRQGVKLGLGLPRLSKPVRKVIAIAVPGAIAASATQINIIVSQSLASFEQGAKSWLNVADRLYQLPLGLVGVAVGVAILPRLSRAARSEDSEGGAQTMDEGLSLAMALTLPAAAALMAAPYFLVDGFFTRGAYLDSDARMTAIALFHFAWGVPAFVLIKVLAPAFFAREDTVTPMRFALVAVALNTALGAGLFIWLRQNGNPGFPGLAIATSTASWCNAALLAFSLSRKEIYTPGPLLRARLVRIALATAAMAVVLIYLRMERDTLESALYGSKELAVLVFCVVGGIVYAAAALLFGAVRPRELAGALKRG